jgi:LPS-assembly protein
LKRILLAFLVVNFSASGENGGARSLIIEGGHVNSKIKRSVVSVDGGVKITRGGYSITADSVTCDRENGKIYLDKKIRMRDNAGNSMFAEGAELSADLGRGTFRNAGIILGRGVSIVSERLEKENDHNYFGHSSNYYFCPNGELNIDLSYEDIVAQLEKDRVQLFSIYSKTSHVDRDRKRIYMNDVFLRFFGIPFFYLPYLSSSRELDIRVSGLSAPSFSRKSYYGYGFSIPLKLYFFDNLDVFFEPFVYQRGNFFLNSTLRFLKGEKLSLGFWSSHIYDNGQSKKIKNTSGLSEGDEGVHRNGRMFHRLAVRALLGDGVYLLGDVAHGADPYVLRDYFNDHRETLESSVSIFKPYGRGYLKLDALGFQQLRERSNAGVAETPRLLSAADYHYASGTAEDGGGREFTLDISLVDALNSFEDRNRKYGRSGLVLDLKNSSLHGGLWMATDLALHSDFYHRLEGSGAEAGGAPRGRVYPEFSVKFSYPLLLSSPGIVVNPLLRYSGSPKRHINGTDLDSKNSELNTNNLFSSNRYSGLDLVEMGNRVSYALRISSSTALGDFNFSLGQGYRDFIEKKYRIAFFERNFSHLLMTLGYGYGNIFLSYGRQMDNRDLGADREVIFINATSGRLFLSVSYGHRSGRVTPGGRGQRKLNSLLDYRLGERISSHFEMTSDLELRRVTSFRIGLSYEDSCYLTKISLGRRNFENFFDRNDTSVTFNFRIKN